MPLPHCSVKSGSLTASILISEQEIRNSEMSVESEAGENPELDHMRALMESQNPLDAVSQRGPARSTPSRLRFVLPTLRLYLAMRSLGRSGDLVSSCRR